MSIFLINNVVSYISPLCRKTLDELEDIRDIPPYETSASDGEPNHDKLRAYYERKVCVCVDRLFVRIS